MSFSLDIGFKNVPIMGILGDLLGSIYLPRGGSEEKRQEALSIIKERQELIEQST